jgi:hypothetical protein
MLKADFYFEKLSSIPKTDSNGIVLHNVDPKRFLIYVITSFKLKKFNDIEKIEEMFSKFKWKKERQYVVKKYLDVFLSRQIYSSTTGQEFKNFVEHLISINFVSRSDEFIHLVILKFLEEKQLDEAFEYFKLNLNNHSIISMEIYLLKESMKQKNKYEEELKQNVFNFMQKIFNEETFNQMIFYAHVLNGNRNEVDNLSRKLFPSTNNQNTKHDLSVLKRLVGQLNSIESKYILRRTCSYLFNLLELKQVRNDSKLKKSIQTIFSDLHKKTNDIK